jgi:DNA-nicking Smr family endonuclease
MTRRLTAEERLLWQKVAGTVRAYRTPTADEAAALMPAEGPGEVPKAAEKAAGTMLRAAPRPPSPGPGETLDGRWDRMLASGKARPDRVIDLHGLTREAARGRLLDAVSHAARRGERLLLVITGKGAAPGPDPIALMRGERVRGAIRADLPRWLGEPGLSAQIAAVRQAGPTRGGEGAVWLVLRRARGTGR